MNKYLKIILLVVLIPLIFGGGFYFGHSLNQTETETKKIEMSYASHCLYQEKTRDNFISLHNIERAKAGLPNLIENKLLNASATQKAKDMGEKGYFSHNTPDGKTPWTFILAQGYKYVYAGENLAEGYPDACVIVEKWMGSRGHRKNILDTHFKDIGVGFYQNKVVVMFGSR